MGLLKFITSRPFVIHIILIGVTIGILTWLTLSWLDGFTFHGSSVAVPDFKGISVKKLDAFVTEKNVRYEIIDSIYDLKAPKGVVLEQDPPADSRVKQNRKIYLTVNALTAEKIRLPDLTALTIRQARSILESYDLRIDSIVYVPSLEEDAVIKQLYRGREIRKGHLIPRGATITLVAGGGLAREKTGVPGLYGLTLEQARQKLEEHFLSLGAMVPDPHEEITDSAAALIYDQKPKPTWDPIVFKGSSIDVYFTNNKARVPAYTAPPRPDTTGAANDTIPGSEEP